MAGRASTQTGERQKRKAKIDAELDKALAQTFPASDPYSVGHITSTEPPARPVDRQAPMVVPETGGTPPSRRQGKSPRKSAN